MKIIYLTSESYIDHSYTIVKEINKHCSFKVYIQAKQLTDEIKKWCSILSAEFRKRKRFRDPSSFFTEAMFLLKIRKLKVDLIWFNTMTLYQVILARLILKNFIVVLHDIEDHPESGEKHGTFSSRLTKKMAGKRICTASKTQAEIYKRHTGRYPLVFQLPVIDYFKENGFKAEKNETVKLRFFFFGSIEKYKGLETLLEAAEILNSKALEYELNIFGKIKYEEEKIISAIKANKNIKFNNAFIDYREIHSIYAQNDVQILPYRQVTQCGPLLIGFSEIIPSVCSDLPGFREYVADGVDGLIFNNTAAGLAEKMESVILNKDLIRSLQEGIKSNALQKFSMEQLAESYMNNFRNFTEN